MVAPSAPRIDVWQDGHRVYIRWAPVVNATDYNVYVLEAGGTFGIEAQLPDEDIEPDGAFFYVSDIMAGIVNVKVTALNFAAEESAYSNEMQVNLLGQGQSTKRSTGKPKALRGL